METASLEIITNIISDIFVQLTVVQLKENLEFL